MNEQADFHFDHEVNLFLGSCRTAGLATVDETGRPCAANIQFVHDDRFQLFFVSSPEATHSRNMSRSHLAAMSIYAHDDRGQNIHDLQMQGTVESVAESERWHHVWELYTGKFSFIAAMPQFAELIQQQQFYCFSPVWMRWVDNRRGFGWKYKKTLTHL